MSDLSKRRLKMWIRLLGVTRVAESHLREFLRVGHKTTLPRFDVMAALYRKRDGVTMSELSRMLLVSNGNATAVVARRRGNPVGPFARGRERHAAPHAKTDSTDLRPHDISARVQVVEDEAGVLRCLLRPSRSHERPDDFH